MGAWKLQQSSKLYQARPLTKWAIISLDDRCRERNMNEFAKELAKNGRNYGMNIADPTAVIVASTRGRQAPSIENVLGNSLQRFRNGCDLMVIVLPTNDSTGMYRT